MDIATGSLIADAAASKACRMDIANLSAADNEYSGCRWVHASIAKGSLGNGHSDGVAEQ